MLVTTYLCKGILSNTSVKKRYYIILPQSDPYFIGSVSIVM